MYTFKNAIYDILSYNPDLDIIELKNILNDEIQSKIIPEILLKIDIPKRLSKVDIKKYELLERRRGAKNIYASLNKKIKKDFLYSELNFIKYQLESDTYNNVITLNLPINENNNYLYQNAIFSDLTQKTYKSENLSKTVNIIQNIMIDPYFSMDYKEPFFLSFSFDEHINNLIIKKRNFQKYILKIEKSIRNSEYTKNIKKININYKNDLEIKTWNKLIIQVIPKEDDFEETINLWDNIQSKVRLNLVNEINNINNKNDKNILKKYFNMTFFHVYLGDE
jgi:hypothetical protein